MRVVAAAYLTSNCRSRHAIAAQPGCSYRERAGRAGLVTPTCVTEGGTPTPTSVEHPNVVLVKCYWCLGGLRWSTATVLG